MNDLVALRVSYTAITLKIGSDFLSKSHSMPQGSLSPFLIVLICAVFQQFCVAAEPSITTASLDKTKPPVQEDTESSLALTPLNEAIYHEQWIDLNKNGRKDVYEDSLAPIDSRILDLLSQMSMEEKTCQLATLYGFQRVLKEDLPEFSWKGKIWKDGIANIDEHLNGIPGWRGKRDSKFVWPPSQHARAMNEVQKWFIEETRLGIPVDFTNEGIRGVCHRRATNFPAQVGLGATWNRDLIEEIGLATGMEAKSLGYTHLYSPILDLARDPRWGRVVECYGEDPFLVSSLGLEQVLGLRKSGIGVTCKHFAVYSVPKGGRDGEARTDPQVSPREMKQVYLRPFETVVRNGDIQGVMSSYNDYDSIPVSGSEEMLTGLLRDRMGFRGYVVSDSGAVRQLNSKHRVAQSYAEAAKQFLEAGGNVRTEFNSPKKFVQTVRDLLSGGHLHPEVVDHRVGDVLRVKYTLGLFDQPYVTDAENADLIVHSDAHRQLALQAARESIVLLKNEEKTLPLRKDLKSILVCGPNALAVGPCISRYGPTMGEVSTVLDAIREIVAEDTEVVYSKGCEVVDGSWPESEIFPQRPSGMALEMIEEAVAFAKAVDVVVAVIGESEHTIGESKSRTALSLTGHQDELIRQLHATGKPVVVVLINGRALSINWIDRYIPAVVEAWFPGEACGTAISEVLFGDYNPGGKLPVTFPRSVGQLPLNFPYKPGSHAGQGSGHNPNGIGNSRVVGSLYPFGHGLSYSAFEYRDLRLSPDKLLAGEPVRVTFTITNTGSRTGDEVTQLYLRDDFSSVVTYDKTLCGFERVSLEPDESRTVEMSIDSRAMEIFNRQMQREVEPGSFSVFVGSSSKDLRLEGSFEVIETSIASKK